MTAPADRLPPHLLDAERAAIGCALEAPALAAELRAGWFYDLRYRTAAEIIGRMAAESKHIAPDTVKAELASQGVAEAFQLVTECVEACHSPANWPYWRNQLTEAETLRKIIQAAHAGIQSAMDWRRPAADILADFERDALAIRTNGNQQEGICDRKSLLQELTRDYEEAITTGRAAGIATGFYDFDRLLGGLKPQQLIVIAARPSIGKTSLALGIADRAAVEDRISVGFFSLEMSGKELLHRLACSRARVDGSRLNAGAVTEAEQQRLAVAFGQIVKAPLHVCDRGGLALAQLTAQARRMVQQHGVKLLVVDYLGLLRSGEKNRSRYEETTLVSNGLKGIAKELNLPLIALAQLNRDTERDGRPPRLSDLRDSGAIEQDADAVVLLHCGEDVGGGDPALSVIVAKNRGGPIGQTRLLFRRAFTRFENLAQTPQAATAHAGGRA